MIEIQPSANPEQIGVRDSLDVQGYANLQIQLDRGDVDALFTSFQRFAELTKMSGGYRLAEAVTFSIGNRDNGDYFIKARKPGDAADTRIVGSQRAPSKDDKNVMHFCPQTIHKAVAHLGHPLPVEMSEFLENCREVYEIGRMAALGASKGLDLKEVLFPTGLENKEVHHLRLIDYYATTSKELGEAHFDRSVATLALSESHPGLVGAPADNGYLRPPTPAEIEAVNDMQPIDHVEGVGKFFLSAGARRLPQFIRRSIGMDDVPILAHGIKNERPGTNRHAAVMFFNPATTFAPYTVPSVEETKLRLTPLVNPKSDTTHPKSFELPEVDEATLVEPDNSVAAGRIPPWLQ